MHTSLAPSDDSRPTDQPLRLAVNVMLPMRDGVHLATDVWLPPQGERFPTLLLRTIYNKQQPLVVSWARYFVEAGYAVVLQDSRGRFNSDGQFDPYTCEPADGYDTQEWIGRQSWCDGNLGMFGLSYSGYTQTISAPLRSRFVKALAPIGSQQDNYGHHRVDGVAQPAVLFNFINLVGRTTHRDAVVQLDRERLLRRLPLISALDDIVGDMPLFRRAIEHETYDDYWAGHSLRERYREVETPAYFMTGWYDALAHETFKLYAGWRTQARSESARRQTRLLVGPWAHVQGPWWIKDLGEQGEFGDVTLGPDANIDLLGEHLRWYDRRLRNVDNGIDEEAPIRLFVMGANRWRSEHEWPLARTRYTDFYLHSGGSANTLDGDGRLQREPSGETPPDRFVYDPADPVPTVGGQQMHPPFGPRDRRGVERRADVLVYTSDPLERDLEVTGPVSATIYAATDAPDTDFTAALVDVYPDGRAIILCEGIRRGRLRASFDQARPIQPGEVYEYPIDLWETGNVFKAGHRIRVEISSSNFPRNERNLNTGERPGFGAEMRAASQTVHHDAARPSRITLPVIPA